MLLDFYETDTFPLYDDGAAAILLSIVNELSDSQVLTDGRWRYELVITLRADSQGNILQNSAWSKKYVRHDCYGIGAIPLRDGSQLSPHCQILGYS
jgi:hypothetical protein